MCEATETVTILRTIPTPKGAHRWATKRWTWDADPIGWRNVSYDAGAVFTVQERSVACLADFAGLLETLRRDPCAFIVRGELLPEVRDLAAANPRHPFRRAKNVGRKGQPPTLAEVPRRWLMIDVDSYPLRSSDDLFADPESAIEAAIRDLLPEPFHDAACWWQLSASAGFVAGVLKVHLFFWLAEPTGNEELRHYLHVHAPAVDRAPYNAAQPHYIADPIVEGRHDPLPRRTGWIKGREDAVTLPTLDLETLRAAVKERKQRARTGAGLDPSAERTVTGVLALLGDAEGFEGWHEPIRRATLLYACQTPPQSRDDEAMKGACRDAIAAAAAREPGKHATADLARLSSDAYLDRLIDGAYAWLKLNRQEMPEVVAPRHAAPAYDADTARTRLRAQMRAFLDSAGAWHAAERDRRGEPRRVGFAVDVGGGKSRAARELIAEWCATQKAAGLPHRVLWLNPTTALSEAAERGLVAELARYGLTCAVHRGRERKDPLRAGDTMCVNLEMTQLARAAGESVGTAICGVRGEGGAVCPFREECGYYRQTAAVAAADVVIAAHETAFLALPGRIAEDLALTVFDEAFWQDGLTMGRAICVAGLAHNATLYPVYRRLPSGRQVRDPEGTDDLRALRARLEQALATAPAGYLRRETLEKAGLTAEDCVRARQLEGARRREGLMRPDMSGADRRKAVEGAGVNAQLSCYASLWTVLADLLAGTAEATGRAELAHRQDSAGNSHWSICLNLLSPLSDAILAAPVMALDATLPPDLVRPYLPRLEAAEAVRIKAPHMQVRQMRGGWGKRTLLPSGARIVRDAAGVLTVSLPRVLAELRDFVLGQTRGERSLVVTYEAAEAAFVGLPGVETAHFNAVAGLDDWSDVRHLFVVGRPRPQSDHVRLIAAALTGDPVEVAESHREPRGVRLSNGGIGMVEVRAYPNELVEMISTAITDAEVVQAIGRARGINRTADNPVFVWILADVATPLLLDELLDWRDLTPSAVERMACRGVVLASATDAAAVFPDLFGTSKAADHALRRAEVSGGDFLPNPLRKILLGARGRNRPVEFNYRPSGRGQQTRRGWARPEMSLEEVREWLEAKLGKLAVFAPNGPEPHSPTPASKPPAALEICASGDGAAEVSWPVSLALSDAFIAIRLNKGAILLQALQAPPEAAPLWQAIPPTALQPNLTELARQGGGADG
ncbi:hypothetical protein [Muricoccus pecuniae]|uniref:Uncharacterized protein n=1 Tax=Muricoccus pecuniae TaxID=693023 RepID=A0A840YIT2_9PROT|nr:hypothetical protein [Roseomonas pecuniae]MBB5696441.1 hypothetical protein [Roseomonas pecuniae]